MTDRPPVRDANVDLLVDQAADPSPGQSAAFDAVQQAAGAAKTASKAIGLPMTGKPMEQTCHRCPRHLSPVTGRGAAGRKERTGVCPKCRIDGVGTATFVTLDDPAALRGHLPDDRPVVQSSRAIDRLEKRQRGANPQSTSDVAAFVDDLMPPGEYVARRTSPMSVVLTWTDDTDVTREDRMALTKRLKTVPTNRRWFVQSFPGFIRLVDQQVGTASDELAAAKTIRGP